MDQASIETRSDNSRALEEFLESGYWALKQMCRRKRGKLLFMEGVLWKRHAVEIFEIARTVEPYCSSSVIYLSEGLRGNDSDLFVKRLGRTWTGSDLLCRLNKEYNNTASILNPPLDNVEKEALQRWELEKNKLTDHPESLAFLVYKGQPIGLGILSSYYTFLRSTTFNPKSMLSKIKNDYINCARIYERALVVLKSEHWTAACVFNERLKYVWPAVLACRRHNLPLLFHERGATMHHYLFSNQSPFNLEAAAQDMIGVFNIIKNDQKLLEEGSAFFTRRRNGDGIGWKSFTANQEHSELSCWRSEAKYYNGIASFFSSSDDEYMSLLDFRMSDVFQDQLGAARWFIQKCQQSKMLPVIRMHPNKAHIPYEELQNWYKLTNDGALVLKPTDTASSYQLLDESRLVAVTLSTMGLEAAHAGKPIIYLGNATEAKAGVGYLLTSEERNSSILDLENKARTKINRALTSAIGYYYLNWGTRYQWYSPTSLHHGRVGKLYDLPGESNFIAPEGLKEAG